ncbi:MAG: hypothetical protein RLO01_10385 [Thalassobaculaceae bacterium]
MSGSSPWSIKGVSREDREIAKEQARKSGEPIGVWLSRRIREASAAGPTGTRSATGSDAGSAPVSTERRVTDRRAPGSPSGDGHDLPPEGDRRQPGGSFGRRAGDQPDFSFGPGNWRQARETILSREDARFSEGLAALRDRVRKVETRLDDRPDAVGDLEERIQGLTERISELVGRLDLLEADRGMDTVERKLDRLESDVMDLDRFARGIPGDTAESVDGLERRLEQLLDRMRVVESFVLPGRTKLGFFGRLFGRKPR